MHPDDEQVSNDQGGTEILGGWLAAEMRKSSFDESQHRVVHPNRVPSPKDQTSATQVEEQVIMTDMRKDPTALVDATRVYAEATSSSVRFLITKNERISKEL